MAEPNAKRSGFPAMRIMGKVYRQVLSIVPVAGVLSLIYSFIEGLFPAAVAWTTANLFDSVSGYLTAGTVPRRMVLLYAFALLGCYGFRQALQVVSSITVNAGVYEKCTSYSSIRIAEKASRLPLLAYEDASVLNLQKRANECARRELLSQLFMKLGVIGTAGIGAASVIAVLASYNIWFVPISLFSVLPYFIARLIRGKEFYYVKRMQSKKTRRLDYLWKLFAEKRTVKEMRTMGFDDYLMGKWTECRDEVNEELWKLEKKDALSLLLCDALRVLGYGISIALALVLVLRGTISIGLFGACLTAFLSVQGQVRSFLQELGATPGLIEFVRDYYEFLDLPEERSGPVPYEGLQKEIAAEDIRFRYPNGDRDAVRRTSLTLAKGEKIAIVGENGSGKTTIAKLLLGLYPVAEGTVRYDGVPVDELNKADFYRRASIISQQFVSYELSLRENIGIASVGRMGEEEKLAEALERAGLAALASEVPLDGQLGKLFGGIELSGGQWQKLAIARGLFRDSELIVMDEPTSALDPLIETEILSGFIEIAKEKTAVIISHRVGLCKLVDKIVVMKGGEVVETGTHRELIGRGGEYTRLYTAQEQWYR